MQCVLNIELGGESMCVGLARVGWPDQAIVVASLSDMASDCGGATEQLGRPLHSLIIVGNVHPLESDYLKMFSLFKDK